MLLVAWISIIHVPLSPTFCQITAVLAILHWLPVNLRIELILDNYRYLSYKTLHVMASAYIKDLL